jgi:hypothetical protein
MTELLGFIINDGSAGTIPSNPATHLDLYPFPASAFDARTATVLRTPTLKGS